MSLVIGAAIMAADIPHHIDWLREKNRDLEVQDFFLPMFLDDPEPSVSAAKAALDGWSGRLGIHGPFLDLKIDAVDPEARAFSQKRLLQGIEAAEKLGADQMVIHSPFTTWDHNNLTVGYFDRAAMIGNCRETLAPVVKRAEETGVTLVIENIEDKEPADRIALVDSFESPRVAVSLDTGHALYAHVSNGGRPVDFHVVEAGKRLQHVHLQDADGYADRHWAPGRGKIDWIPLFEAFEAHAPETRLVMELKDHFHLPAGYAHLKALGVAE